MILSEIFLVFARAREEGRRSLWNGIWMMLILGRAIFGSRSGIYPLSRSRRETSALLRSTFFSENLVSQCLQC